MPSGIIGLARGIVALRSGDRDAARRELDHIHPDWHFGRAINHLATLAEIVAEVGRPDEQRRMHDLLSPFADCYAAWGLFGLTCGPPIASLLGNLAAALGDAERATAHFESAYAMTTRSDALVGRAWTGYWYARMLAATGSPASTRVAEAAIADAARTGVTNLVERCRALVSQAPVASSSQSIQWTPPASTLLAMVERSGSWLVTYGEHQFLAPNLRGMPMLARLVENPHVEIHSIELVSGSAQTEWDTSDAGEHLDARARDAYRKRLTSLAEAIEAAEGRGDVEAAEAAHEEQAALMKELSRAVGVRGKVRRAGVAGERARITAQRRLRDAVHKISELDAALGEHLTAAIRTGTFCVYRP
jgi:hypothetical protein